MYGWRGRGWYPRRGYYYRRGPGPFGCLFLLPFLFIVPLLFVGMGILHFFWPLILVGGIVFLVMMFMRGGRPNGYSGYGPGQRWGGNNWQGQGQPGYWDEKPKNDWTDQPKNDGAERRFVRNDDGSWTEIV